MHRDCVEEIEKAIGRSLTLKDEARIESEIGEQMKNLARANPQAYMGMTQPQRMAQAAALAQQQLINKATLQRQRAGQAIVSHSQLNAQFTTGLQAGTNGARTLGGMLNKVDIYVKGVAREYFSNLVPAIQAVEPRFFGLMENLENAKAFAHEVMDGASGKSGSKEMQAAAKVWLETIEGMRVRFNRAGGDIGKLGYGYLPQPHDVARLRQIAGDAWAAKVLPLLDRSQYVDAQTGRLMGDPEMLGMLARAHETLVTDGMNTATPGQFQGTGARANKGNDHRAIHFKDADSYIAYMQEFGKGSVFGAMQSHIGGLGKDIGLLERMGPNPEQMFRTFDDMAVQADRGQRGFGMVGVTNPQLWDTLSGKAAQVQHQRLADIAQNIRNVEVFGKLQGALVSSITDVPTLLMTARFNKLPVFETFVNTLRSFGKDTKDYANRAGLVADSMIGDMNRWADSNLKDNWSSKLSSATMKASFLEGWTDALRRGFSVTMQGGLGKLSRTDWGKLDAGDRTRLEAKGVTPEDFKVWQLATPEKWRGSDMLTPESIRAIPDTAFPMASAADIARTKDQAVSRLLGVIVDESEYASLAPDLHARTLISWGGQQRGTMGGELSRSIMLFKGFPLSMLTRHWGRILNDDMTPASRVAYAATLATGLTTLGALAMQAKDLLGGKDPRDMTSPKFWAAAAAQGGGMGFAGDIIYQAMGGGRSQSGVSTASNVASTVAGPVAGSVFEGIDLTLGNIGQAIKGEETHAGAESFRYVRSHMPAVNLWYIRSVLDHAFMNDVQEMLSPGYLSRMQQRVKKDWGQDFFYNPRDALPGRAPDLSAAGGH